MSTSTLDLSHFPAFFRELHAPAPGQAGPSPFPWQERLVAEVAATGAWPQLLDLPTGSGKTAAIDVAVFLLALGVEHPRRIVFVVDRRIVVHQAAVRAERIARRLRSALESPERETVLGAVARGLAALCPVDGQRPTPMAVAELRGGIVRDDSWTSRPDVPTVLVSTVDQVGSRLLFRGYGVTRCMRPVHAGLLGNDALFLLDEVHLSQPFRHTLAAIRDHYRPPAGSGVPERWQVAELSATPVHGPEPSARFGLDAADRDRGRAEALVRRLAASKPFRTRRVPTKGKDAARHRSALVDACVREAMELLDAGAVTVGVIVNRVLTATEVHRALDRKGIATVLLTGRMRPLDRDDLLRRVAPRIVTGWRDAATTELGPLVLVATQAIEAGADFDLDAIVTECASLDALRQRFGRVDRDGRLSEKAASFTSVVVATSPDVADGSDDAIYGPALAQTWRWLAQGPADMGIDAMRDRLEGADIEALLTPRPPWPQLFPSHLDRWAQTSQAPDADPLPGHWLHGLGATSEEVSVVWRGDLDAGAMRIASEHESEIGRLAHDGLVSLVAACPPNTGEAMSLPLGAVRRWLVGLNEGRAPVPLVADVADVQRDVAQGDPGEDGPRSSSAIAPVLRWRGDDSTIVVRPDKIGPGDTLVVPISYGGIRAFCWDPSAHGSSGEQVTDLATRAHALRRGRAVLRLDPATLPDGLPTNVPRPDPAEDVDRRQERLVVQEWLDDAALALGQLDDDTDPPDLLAVVRALAHDRARSDQRFAIRWQQQDVDSRDDDAMFVLSSRRRLDVGGRWRKPDEGAAVDTEPDTSSFIGTTVTLREHLSDVERWARVLATNCGLTPSLVEDLALAGRLHDLGKADPRFQVGLRGGELAGPDDPLLAKSATAADDRWGRRRAMDRAGYPRGERHEMLSVALVEPAATLRALAGDWELVLHLVASHHGWARPFAPVILDDRPVDVMCDVRDVGLSASSDHGRARLDAGIPQRFWALTRRYGWFGLAWLEAILRLADHRGSAEAQSRTASPLPVAEVEL